MEKPISALDSENRANAVKISEYAEDEDDETYRMEIVDGRPRFIAVNFKAVNANGETIAEYRNLKALEIKIDSLNLSPGEIAIYQEDETGGKQREFVKKYPLPKE